MGEIVKMTCRSCGKSYQCKTGCGVSHSRLDAVVELFEEETQQRILKQTEGQRFPLFSFQYLPAYCEGCKDIVGVPVLQLLKEQVNYVGNCSECAGGIDAEGFGENVLCPECEGMEFDVSRVGFWD